MPGKVACDDLIAETDPARSLAASAMVAGSPAAAREAQVMAGAFVTGSAGRSGPARPVVNPMLGGKQQLASVSDLHARLAGPG